MVTPFTSPPALGTRRPVRFPPFDVRTLPNGLRIYFARLARVPLVRMDLLVPAGATHDGAGRAGLATLAACLLDEGPPGSTATEIAEELGGTLHAGATWNTAVANVTLLSEHLAEGLRLLARVALEARFPDREVERLCQQRVANLGQQRHVASFVAERTLARAVYGETVYGRPLYGTQQSIASLTRRDFLEFHRAHYGIGGMALVVAGDFSPDELMGRVEEAFSPPPPRPSPPAVDETAPPRGPRSVHLVDVPHAPQVQLRIGHAGPPYADPRFIAADLMNAVLGGRSTSRINLRLRERLGYTYGAQSQFCARLGPGPFEVSAAVTPHAAAAAAAVILDEMERIQRQPVGRDELDDAREYLTGVWATYLQTIEGVVNKLSQLAIFGLDAGHLDGYPQAIGRVTEVDLQHAAQQCLHPDRAAIVAAGPMAVLAGNFDSFGPVERWDPAADLRGTA